MATLAVLESALSGLRISTPAATSISASLGRRHASHQAQGRANKAKQGPGKRLGAKKTGGEYVVPGNILFKQRGTHWFPGDNCMMVCILSA
jgi:large subunit ribosomal protein L27